MIARVMPQSKHSMSKNLTERHKDSPVLIYSINELSNTDKILLMNNARVGGFKKILGNRN
jgi:hypothetical protein